MKKKLVLLVVVISIGAFFGIKKLLEITYENGYVEGRYDESNARKRMNAYVESLS